MKAKDRDDLLARLDERSLNTWRVVEKIESHQAEQNSGIQQALLYCQKNSVWINTFKWAIGIIVTGFMVLFSKIQGWW